MRSEKLNENAIHELEVVDTVVRGGGHARPEDAALTDFALLVRNARPVPDHGAAMRLDERIAAAPKVARGSRKPLITAVASLALVIVVAGTAINLNRSPKVVPAMATGDDSGASAERGFSAQAMNESASDRGGPEDLRTVMPQIEGTQKRAAAIDRSAQRDVARNAMLTLATPAAKLERLSDEVIETVDEVGGYVANSEVRTAQGSRGRAEFLLMLKAETFQETFKDLSRLAHVRSRSQSTEDITAQSNEAKRGVELRQKRIDQLGAKLKAADSAPERAAIQRQLNSAKFALRQAQRDVRANSARVNFVPVELKIVADDSAATAAKGTIGKAVQKAGEILTGIAAVLIILLAVGLPITAVGAMAYAGHRRWRRSRANRAIGAAAAQPE